MKTYIPTWKWPMGQKYRGWTLTEIWKEDPQYLQWAAAWKNASPIRERVRSFLKRHEALAR